MKGKKLVISRIRSSKKFSLLFREMAEDTNPLNPTSKRFKTKNRTEEDHRLVRRDLPNILQRDTVRPCISAASTSIISGAKAVDFAAFAAGILTLVLNINNNINNNNNNNNNLNINAVDSSNIVANFNTNNANQVNIMPPGGRRRKRSVAHSSAAAILALIKIVVQIEEDQNYSCRDYKICQLVGESGKGAMEQTLLRYNL